jgi:NADH:ubiquinone oxidoreductase subunit
MRASCALLQPRRTLFAAATDWLLKRRLVGADAVARFYEVAPEDGDARGGRPRRILVPHDADADVTQIAPEWVSWLRGTRSEPPTAQEVQQLAQARADTQRKAAELAQEERRRRERARVVAQTAPAHALGHVEPNNGSEGRGGAFAPHGWTPPPPT